MQRWLLAAALSLVTSSVWAINITMNFNSGASASPNYDPGRSDLIGLFNYIESFYESVFADAHNLTINFWYAELDSACTDCGAGTLGLHSLVSEGGSPHRETVGNIRIDSSQNWFIDPTPGNNSEFAMRQTLWRDLTSAERNDLYNNVGPDVPQTFEVGYWGNAVSGGAADGRIDMLSVVLHEMGHALGMASSNNATVSQTNDNDYDFNPVWLFGQPLAAEVADDPVAGPDIAHLDADSNALMNPSTSNGIRTLASHTDLFSMASGHQYTQLDVPRREFYGGTNWNTRGNWSGNAVPGGGDEAFVRLDGVNGIDFSTNTSVVGLNVEFGTQSFDLNEHTFTINSTTTIDEDGRIVVRFGQFNANGTSGLRVGQDGAARFTQSTGGNVSVANNLSLGNTADGAGMYDMTTADEAKAPHLSVDGTLSVGRLGKGDFVQNTGEVDATILYVGEFTSASGDQRGRYVLNAGDVDVQTLEVGRAGTGRFEQHAGDVYVGVSHLRIGHESTGDGTYDMDGGLLRTEAGLDIYVGFDGSGTVTQDGGTIQGGRSLQLGVNAGSDGGFIATAGTATFPGAILVGRAGNGRVEVSDTASISSGDTLVVARDSGSIGEIVQNDGLVGIAKHAYLGFEAGTDAKYFLNGGDLEVGENLVVGFGDEGFFRQTGGTVKVLGDLTIAQEATATGRYELQGGTLDVSAGELSVGAENGEFEFSGGTLHVGTFNGDLTNQGGTLAPGSSPGTTIINGDYIQESGKLLMELASAGFDRLVVHGDLTLGGVLEVALLGSYSPIAGSSFHLLEGAISGSFASVMLPALSGGLGWNTSQLHTDGILSIIGDSGGGKSGLDGDYNNDGIVDAADYTIWRNLFGTNGPLQNESESLGIVDAADYGAWKQNFGNTVAGGGALQPANSGASTPEPTTAALLVGGTMLMLAVRRRRHGVSTKQSGAD